MQTSLPVWNLLSVLPTPSHLCHSFPLLTTRPPPPPPPPPHLFNPQEQLMLGRRTTFAYPRQLRAAFLQLLLLRVQKADKSSTGIALSRSYLHIAESVRRQSSAAEKVLHSKYPPMQRFPSPPPPPLLTSQQHAMPHCGSFVSSSFRQGFWRWAEGEVALAKVGNSSGVVFEVWNDAFQITSSSLDS
jgi:hypothetical protein